MSSVDEDELKGHDFWKEKDSSAEHQKLNDIYLHGGWSQKPKPNHCMDKKAFFPEGTLLFSSSLY